MPVLSDKLMTRAGKRALVVLALVSSCVGFGRAQPAASLKQINSVYVDSLGPYAGAEELRRELVHYLGKTGGFQIASTAAQADAVLDGRGELWVRGYHSLSPRARANSSNAEAVYDGYLSVKVHGKDGEILWSYFADPPRVSFHELKRDLVTEVGGRLMQDRNLEVVAPQAARSGTELPALLRGAGATFPLPIYQDWFKNFHSRHPNWGFEYSASGSEAGVSRLAAGGLDFAGSDIPPDALKSRLAPGNNAFPTVGGAVAVIYNLPGFTGELRLTAELISGIFSGRIQLWDDPALIAVNPSQALPHAHIQTFHRSDGSGTTFALTDYLARVDAAWRAKGGAAARLEWAAGKEADGNEALAAAVASTPYSLGYVEFIYAFGRHLSFASIRNQAGRFVKPDLLSIMAASNGAGDREEYLGVSIANSPVMNAYPISTFSWLLISEGLEPAKKTAATAFLEWMLTSGQRECSALGYAPLPRNLVDREMKAVRKLK